MVKLGDQYVFSGSCLFTISLIYLNYHGMPTLKELQDRNAQIKEETRIENE